MCSGARQFDTWNGGDFLGKTQFPYVRRPIVNSVVLCGRGEFDVFGSQVDDSIVRPADIVTTWRGVIVKIRANPTGRGNRSTQGRPYGNGFARLQNNVFFEMVVLDTPSQDYSILPGSQGYGKISGFRMVLIPATMGSIRGSQIRRRSSVDSYELSLAGRKGTILLTNLEGNS